MRPKSRHHGRTVRRANRLRDVRVAKDHALPGEPVQMRRVNPPIPIRRHRVGPLLVCPEKQQIRLSLLPNRRSGPRPRYGRSGQYHARRRLHKFPSARNHTHTQPFDMVSPSPTDHTTRIITAQPPVKTRMANKPGRPCPSAVRFSAGTCSSELTTPNMCCRH